MDPKTFKANLIRIGLSASMLLAAGASLAQSVYLTAAPTQAVLPDGQSVPMWGYSCGNGTTAATAPATCSALNPNAGGNWSPVLITTAAGSTLTINLTNGLSIPITAGGSGANSVPTSLVIVGQLGGGLGSVATTTPSPAHAEQGPTWPASGGPTGINCAAPGAAASAAAAGTNCPPPQPPRVQSFATEVLAGASASLTWSNLRPGTYLIQSGTHPSIQAPMGLYGVLVVTTPASGATPAQAYAGVSYDADVPLVFSEIDPVQNRAVATALATAGFSETRVWSGQPNQCGDPNAAVGVLNTCYPPVVNYDPRYYLINGVSFDRTNLAYSTFPVVAPGASAANPGVGVLLRFVNAGSRMHVPTVVGQSMTLYAEDGNVLPGVPKVQNEVFLAAGKTYDVGIQPVSPGTAYAAATYAVYDRQLSLSTNNQRDGGMQAYIAVAGGVSSSAPVTPLSASDKTYYCVAGTPLAVSDPSKGVLAGATGANGAMLSVKSLPAGANLAFQSNGTFTYIPPSSGACGGSFSYLVNGTLLKTATITQCDASTPGCAQLGGPPVANADAYTGNTATRLQISPPGVLLNDTDPAGLPLSVDTASVAKTGPNAANLTLAVNADGSSPVCHA